MRDRRRGVRSSVRTGARVVATVSLSALGLLSCASLLGVEDYKDSTGELCDLLESCYNYENCSQHIGPPLDSASPAVRTLWLASLSDKACLEQCSSARRCLNMAPVCFPQGQTCSRIEECCGFLTGEAGCAGPDGQMRCCLADGASCTNSDQCCSPEGCSTRTNTCGEDICAAVGQPCQTDIKCCTKLCGADNICVENICSTTGQACLESAECCPGLACLGGRCGVGTTCRGEGEKCYVDSPDPTLGCCSGDCVPTGSESGIPVGLCSAQGCLLEGSDCKADPSVCCAGLTCDKFKQQCGEPCKGTGAQCAQGYECCSGSCVDGACECSEGSCTQSSDCCGTTGSTGICIAGACAPKCGTKACHDICAVGAPMDTLTCPSAPPAKTDAINYVCTTDPYCCCVKWDDLCAEAAAIKAQGCM